MSTRVVLGRDLYGANTTGLWVTKPGFDAGTNTLANFLIHPDKINAQPAFSGYITTVPYTSDVYYPIQGYNYRQVAYVTQITHNLGHRPICLNDLIVPKAEPMPTAALSCDTVNVTFSFYKYVLAGSVTTTPYILGAEIYGFVPITYFIIRVAG